mmetsp:Transcript_148047/g.258226  ORF Transcript_148047/g.258226 Transcript_148047/m.258226 type:complete len:217 (+) Transcript_148047:259-909(+)
MQTLPPILLASSTNFILYHVPSSLNGSQPCWRRGVRQVPADGIQEPLLALWPVHGCVGQPLQFVHVLTHPALCIADGPGKGNTVTLAEGTELIRLITAKEAWQAGNDELHVLHTERPKHASLCVHQGLQRPQSCSRAQHLVDETRQGPTRVFKDGAVANQRVQLMIEHAHAGMTLPKIEYALALRKDVAQGRKPFLDRSYRGVAAVLPASAVAADH